MKLIENYLNSLYEQEFYPKVEPLIGQSFKKYVGECRRRYPARPVTDQDIRKVRSCQNKAMRRAYQTGRRYLENKQQTVCNRASNPRICNDQTIASIMQLKSKIVTINKIIYADDKALGRI